MDLVPLSGKLTSLAGRYAKTLFDLSAESKEITSVAIQFADFCNFIKSHENLHSLIFSPALSRQEHAAVFNELSQKLNLSRILTNFISILAENRRLNFIFNIQGIFQELVDHNESLSHAEVVSAIPLTTSQQEKISQILSLHLSGKLAINYKTNPAHLGGLLVRIGNQIIDLTLANQLNHLANAMKGNA
ncbi:MAG: ATP synthase F1 subunit delta [Candidatus Paracaedibacteraceae bacterium]|nr:ATP synthase F1 subunit delta [Candidatus Paracaedibacteraceae bacterium]